MNEIRCTKCGESKAPEFFKSHKDKKNGRTSWCRACSKAANVFYQRKWRLANPEHKKLWHLANIERVRVYDRERLEQFPEKNCFFVSKYLAIKRRALPTWADLKAIAKVYASAAARTKETGVVHHVDHIVPIRSKSVCGLHVHHNLQVLTSSENRSKSNLVWPDMP